MDMQFMKMQILEVGLLILGAYIGGLIARRMKISEIVGQIMGGMFVGPHFWEWMRRLFFSKTVFNTHTGFAFVRNFYQNGGYQQYSQIFENYNFIIFLFLGVIAFSLGEELHHERLRQAGIRATCLCIFQGFLTFLVISFGMKMLFWNVFSWVDAFIVGSIGIATAPSITFTVMNKFRIEGQLKKILSHIIVLDDIMEVIFFSIFLAFAQLQLMLGSHLTAYDLGWKVAKELGFAVLVAFGIFFVLKFAFIRRRHDFSNLDKVDKKTEANTFLSTILFNQPTPSVEILLIIIGVVAVGIALAIQVEAPFLISAVIAGYLIANYHHSAFFDSLKIDNVMPIFNLLFMGMIGANIHIETFNLNTILFSFVYFILRASGKLFGNWSGAIMTGQDPKIVGTLPKLMLPQAGIAVVEIVFVSAILKNSSGQLILNTTLPALVLFELWGAHIAERTLEKWRNYTYGEKEAFAGAVAEKGKFLDINELLKDRVYELGFENKEEILHRLIGYAALQETISDEVAVFNAVVEREKLGHVSTSNGLALPHSRIRGIKEPYIFCALLKKPFKWNDEDEYLVHTVFLILTPEDKPQIHLSVLRTISVFSKQSNFSHVLHEMAILTEL